MLDQRHRNKNGEINKKHGNTLIGTLRKHYGMNFAKRFSDKERLSYVLQKLADSSLSQLVRDHESGNLERICRS